MALSGRCLCKGVRYELHGDPVSFGFCHCTRCQREGGGGNQAFLVADRESLRITEGEALLTTFSEEGHTELRFCSHCGSSLFGSSGDMVFVSAGSLSEDPGLRPEFHAMVDYKAAWEEINDDLPQFGEFPTSAA